MRYSSLLFKGIACIATAIAVVLLYSWLSAELIYYNGIAVSENGEFIALSVASEDCNLPILLQEALTGASTIIPRKSGYNARNPVFSKDGTKLFFIEWDGLGFRSRLLVYDIASATVEVLAEGAGYWLSLAISPNGEKLAVSQRIVWPSQGLEGEFAIVEIDVETRGQRIWWSGFAELLMQIHYVTEGQIGITGNLQESVSLSPPEWPRTYWYFSVFPDGQISQGDAFRNWDYKIEIGDGSKVHRVSVGRMFSRMVYESRSETVDLIREPKIHLDHKIIDKGRSIVMLFGQSYKRFVSWPHVYGVTALRYDLVDHVSQELPLSGTPTRFHFCRWFP